MKKEVKKEVKQEKSKKKIAIIVGSVVVLVLIAIAIWWLFFRKIEVTLDYNNNSKDETIFVRVNKTINKKDIKDKKELGDKFIGWFKVVEVKKGKEILAKKPFNFKNKITKKIKLNAVYSGEVETITVRFESNGGTKVDDIILNKGVELELPADPTRDGYTFGCWKDKNEVPIGNGALLADDITLYAYWDEVKKEETKKEETKPETISLSLSRSIGHAYGYNTGKATASVENPSGEVEYSTDSPCLKIDTKTGDFEVVSMHGRSDSYQLCINRGTTATITANLPSGKSDSKEFVIEPILIVKDGDTTIEKNGSYDNDGDINLISSVDVTWNDDFGCGSWKQYGTPITRTVRNFSGSIQCYSPGYLLAPNFTVNPTSAGGQKISFSYYQVVN